MNLRKLKPRDLVRDKHGGFWGVRESDEFEDGTAYVVLVQVKTLCEGDEELANFEPLNVATG